METAVVQLQERLIEKCRRGDAKAQRELYGRYIKAMYNICFRMLNNHEDAEDVVQDSFIKAFHDLRQFKGDSTFGAWLKRIVINHCINFLKKKRLLTEDLEQHDYHLGSTEETDDNISYSVQKVQRAMHQLPEGYRVVFSLYMLEGYDHREISEILGIGESSSKSQLNRAKAKIRNLVKAM